jgi:hypothetical protein
MQKAGPHAARPMAVGPEEGRERLLGIGARDPRIGYRKVCNAGDGLFAARKIMFTGAPARFLRCGAAHDPRPHLQHFASRLRRR